MEASITHTQSDNDKLKTELSNLQNENTSLKMVNDKLKTDNQHLTFKKDEISGKISQLKSRYEQEKVQLESRLQLEKHAVLMDGEQRIKKVQRTTSMSLTNKQVTFPLNVDWKNSAEMPVAMSEYIQSVQINNAIYVGGGWTGRSAHRYIIMVYNTNSSQWHTLPPYSARKFAMTSVNNKLVLVGGLPRVTSDSGKELGVWQSDSSQWTYPFPPMSIPRYSASATSYKHWLVVAGGNHRDYSLHPTIEVLDVSNMQWCTGPCTPILWKYMKSTIIEDTWYLMGGYSDELGNVPDVYSVSLDALVSQSASDSCTVWRKLPSLDCIQSCSLSIGGSLLAVGGRKDEKPVSTIQRYAPETNTWVLAGLLKHTLSCCTCLVALDKIHVIVGWDGESKIKSIFISDSL